MCCYPMDKKIVSIKKIETLQLIMLHSYSEDYRLFYYKVK